jgi:hypothetical protein
MGVLNRNMFNRGGYAHRGTGITSGLAQPIQKFQKGGLSKKDIYRPAWMSLFGGMMSGKSLQGGFGGAMDILGQSVQQSAPLFAQAAQTMASQDTDRKTYKDANGFLRYEDDGSYVFPGTVKTSTEVLGQGKTMATVTTTQEGDVTTKINMKTETESPTRKNYILSPNSILVNDVGETIARGEPNKSTTLSKLRPGEKLYDSDGNMIAHYADPNAQIIKLNPGQIAYDKDGNVLFQAPANAKNQQIIKLSAGQTAFDADGNEIASMAKEEPVIKLNPGQTAYDKDGNVLFQAPANATNPQIIKLSPGQTAYDKDGNEIVSKAPNIQDEPIIKLNPGQTAYDKDGNILFASPDSETEEKIVKLSPGQEAFQMVDGKLIPLQSVPLKESDRIVNVAPGQVLFDKDTNEIVFENPSTVPVQRLSTLSPGQSLVDREGNVVYTAPTKDKYFKLSPGQIVYDINNNIVAQAPSISDDQASYGAKELTENELAFKRIKNYESQMTMKDNGEFDTSDLTDHERRNYFRLLNTYDPDAKAELKTWNEFKSDLLGQLGANIEYTEMLEMAKARFEANPATGPFRGRLATAFSFMQDLTGVDFSKVINNLVTEDDDFLLQPENLEALNQVRNQLAVMGQKFMKGQVNTFEQELILGSLFNKNVSEEGNRIIFENLIYLGKLKKAMIQTSNKVNNQMDFASEMEEWKKRNRPKYMKDALNEIGFSEGNNLTDIEKDYGLDEGSLTGATN